jgi:hypothetical protein
VARRFESGYAAWMRFSTPMLTVLLTLTACGAPPAAPATSPNTTPTATTAEPEPEAPGPPSPHVEPVAPPVSTPPPEAEAQPEKCDGDWVCVKVSFETRKVDKRATKLMGDPKIESTWSKTSDGRTVAFDAFSKGAVELTLRRKPGNKNEVVVKAPKGGEIVIDRHNGSVDDFTHVGVIAAEKDGALLIDMRYLR